MVEASSSVLYLYYIIYGMHVLLVYEKQILSREKQS